MFRTTIWLFVFPVVFVSATCAFAQNGPPLATTIPFGKAVEHAEEAAALHSKDTPPYHLKAGIVETTNPQSEYRAEIEEFFQSEENWRRTVTAPGLSWTQEMRDGQLQEQYSGDYAPLWLRDLLSGITGRSSQLVQLNGPQQPFRLVASLPGGLEFRDYQPFHDKWIARKMISYPESGTTLQLTITELSDLKVPLPATPLVPNPAPLVTIEVAQAVEQPFLKSDANLHWPLARSGNIKGYIRVFLGVGPDGKVREVWPEVSDNGEMEDYAREQMRNWQFTPYLLNGLPVAVSTHWTMPFETKIGVPLPELSDAEARELASHTIEPSFPPGTAKPGQELRVRISVNEQGKLTGVDNPDGLGQSFLAIDAAVSKWKFRPLIQDGKAQYFHAWLVFKVR
jgi:hypothetical protein